MMQKPVAPLVQDVLQATDASDTPSAPPALNPARPRLLAVGRGVVLFCIRAYQATAPMRPAVCRYQPTCSEYTAQCVAKHGVWKGVALGIRRILRCNPLSSGGYDPAP